MRTATIEDIPAIMPMVERMCSEYLQGCDMDPESAREFLESVIDSAQGAVIFSDSGFAAVNIVSFHLNKHHKTAYILAFHAEPGQAEPLLDAVERWSENKADTVGFMSANPESSGFFESRGWTQTETLYMR